MSVELESDILAASWDRPELSVEQEATPEIQGSPEQQEIPRPIEAALELLRKYRKETIDIPEEYEEDPLPPSYYLLQNEVGEHQLFEASLTEESQHESLETLSTTDDLELRSLLIDELGLKSAWQEIWPPETKQSTIESLVLYGVAIAPRASPEQQSMGILVLAENGHDVSKVEIPQISFSSDEEFTIEEPAEQNIQQDQQEVGASTYSVQLMRTHEGFVFYKDGIPQAGIDQSDPRIQAAIDQLLNQGIAVDIEEIESARIRIETTYRCDGDPTSLEIGQFIDIDIESIPFPIENEQEVIDDEDDGGEDQVPQETALEENPAKTTLVPIASENQSNVPAYDGWFFAIDWTIGEYSEAPTDSPIAAIAEPSIFMQQEVTPAPLPQPLALLSSRRIPEVFDVVYDKNDNEDPPSILPAVTPVIGPTTQAETVTEAITLQTASPVAIEEHSTVARLDAPPATILAEDFLYQKVFATPKIQREYLTVKPEQPANPKPEPSLPKQNQELSVVMPVVPQAILASEPTTPFEARRVEQIKPRNPDIFQLPMTTNVQEQTSTTMASTQQKERIATTISERAVLALGGVSRFSQTTKSTRRVESISAQQSTTHESFQNHVASEQTASTAIKTTRVQTENAVVRTNKKEAVLQSIQQVVDEKERVTQWSSKANRGVHRRTITNTQTVEQSKTDNTRRSTHSNRATKTYQAHMLPTGKDESAGSVVAAVVERYTKRAELERRRSQMTIDTMKDAKILREQIRPLGVLIDDIGRIVRQFPSATMHIAINQQSVVFTPEIANPIDQAALLTRLATLSVSITNRQRIAFIYQLRTVA